MSRPQKNRFVHNPPIYDRFKPVGVGANSLEQIALTLDEYEAIRLADYENMEHLEASKEMSISRSTFSRLVDKARSKVAKFIIDGKQLYIEGGNIHFKGNLIRCNDCGNIFNTDFEKTVKKCPNCNSANIVDLAGGFGHGECCQGGGNRHRRGRGHNTF